MKPWASAESDARPPHETPQKEEARRPARSAPGIDHHTVGPDARTHIRIFRYLEHLDAFEVTPEYAELAARLGLGEWNPVVWIGRYLALDNDFGEHWFDNWDEREALEERARELGLDAERLLIVNPDRFQDGRDGPCHSPEMRRRFWTEVLMSLELSEELLFDEARENNRRTQELLDGGNEALRDLYIPDLEERSAAWLRENRKS